MIKLSETAVKELSRLLVDLPDTVVRTGVSGGGCSGFMYNLQFDDVSKINENEDKVIEQDGIKLVVDKKSLLYMDDTTINFVEDLSKRGFVFDNPNATKTCGCNKSFSA